MRSISSFICFWLLLVSFCADANPCIQIFYDKGSKNSEPHYIGRIHALFIQNLMGHFPHWKQKLAPIESYKKGELENCKANIYLGTFYNTEIPADFLFDFVNTNKNVLWAGYGIWKIPTADLNRVLGISYKGLSSLDSSNLDVSGRPTFYNTFTYKGEVFTKYGEFDRKDPHKFNAAFEMVLLNLATERSPSSHVLSWAEHNFSHDQVPYLINQENRWYLSDSPFSFTTEQDRYLIFTDVLFDLLEEKPLYSEVRPAFVRFEDIHPCLPLWQLEAYSRIFREAQAPFTISLIPIFADPLMARVDDPAQRFTPLTKAPFFLSFLRNAEEQQGSFLYHGITHQYRDKKNPFNGMSGDDFEFWDAIRNAPLVEDSADYVLNRLQDGFQLIKQAGITTHAWLTPHYQASPLDFIVFGQVFDWNVGRVTYFPAESNLKELLPGHLSFDRAGPDGQAERLSFFKHLKVSHPENMLPNGQFFPFEIFGDFYGQRLIPENLGNIQPFLNEQVYKTQDIADMARSAKRNRVLRDHWASLFIHPVLVYPPSDEGVGDFPGDGKKITELIRTIQSLGYQFISLKEWTKQHPMRERPQREEIRLEKN
jgi:uncharacterized protein YdaL